MNYLNGLKYKTMTNEILCQLVSVDWYDTITKLIKYNVYYV